MTKKKGSGSDKNANLSVPIENRYPVLTDKGYDLGRTIEISLDGEEFTPRTAFTRIKMPSGESMGFNVSELPRMGKTKEFFEGILLHVQTTRVYFEKDYDDPTRDKKERPKCDSVNGITGIGNPGGLCAICPLNEYGTSKKAGSRAKACRERKLHYILLPGMFFPIYIDGPPTSKNNLRNYTKGLISMGINRHQVISRIGLELAQSNGNNFSKLTYEEVEDREITDPGLLERINRYREGLLKLVAPDEMEMIAARRKSLAEATGIDPDPESSSQAEASV